MEDKEILAELKKMYEYIIDMTDNADETQLNKADKSDLFELIETISKKYNKIYENIKNENDISLYYEENLLIADEVGAEYMDTDGEYILSADIGTEHWWEDSDFIYEF